MTIIHLLDERARTAGPADRWMRALDARPVVGIERVVVRHLVLGAEQAARKIRLGEVVEHAPAAVGLPAIVAEQVSRESESRRDLVAEAKVDPGIFLDVRRHVL